MRAFWLILLPVIAVYLMCVLVVDSNAGWGPGGCGPVGPMMQPPIYQQVPSNWAGCSAACVCGCNSGGRCPCGNGPSVPPTIPEKKIDPADLPTGVVTDKIYPDNNSICGKKCSKRDLIDAVREGMIPEDRNKLRVTIIGSDADRQAVESDLATNPALKPLNDQYLLVSCRPDDYRIAGNGFVTTGKPTIYCQKAEGKTLYRQDTYDGPARFAVTLREAIRKADPNYDPTKDPDPTKPKQPDPPLTPSPTPDPTPTQPTPFGTRDLLCCGLIVAVVWLITKGKK